MTGPLVTQVERRARRMNEMIKALDVDEVALMRLDRGEAYAGARTKCLRCVCPGECLAWLDAGAENSEALWYCPNRDVFARCRR
ncbi:MAG: hypothetical protein KJ587_10205 [Alphaproteobacteria bacterium]|nr:hypothetical protein [Alphaproteobacteria bacterium]